MVIKNKNALLLIVLFFCIVFSACLNSEELQNASLSTDERSSDASAWIGVYEYLYSTDPDSDNAKVIMHQLSVYEDDGQYFAEFSMDGWLTSYKARLAVEGDEREISLLFDNFLSGTTIAEDQFNPGDIIFILRKNGELIETEIGKAIEPYIHEVSFVLTGGYN